MTSIIHEPPPDKGLPVPSICVQVQAPSFVDPPQPPCLDDATRAQVLDAIKSLIGGRWPGAFVTSECVADQAAGDAAAFGVWPAGPQNPTPDQRDELLGYLRGPIGRQFGETIAFAFSPEFLYRQAHAQVGVYTGDGDPDPNGPVHIQDAWVELSAPDTVITKASGYDERPVPDADFTLTLTEPLTRGGDGQFNVPTKRSIDVDTTWQDILDFALSFSGPPWSDLGLAQSWLLHTASAPDKTGVGAGVVAAFLGPSVPIPGGKKLQIFYTRAEATPDGMRVGGVITGESARSPTVSASVLGGGPAEIEFSRTQTVAVRSFGLTDLQDMRPPLSVHWAVDGWPASDQPTATVEFSAPAPGTATVETVSVTVTDADGLTAHSDVPVRLSSPRDKQHHGPNGSGNPLNEP
jgi:hypothetical protein